MFHGCNRAFANGNRRQTKPPGVVKAPSQNNTPQAGMTVLNVEKVSRFPCIVESIKVAFPFLLDPVLE
jgi:hypothetical protein